MPDQTSESPNGGNRQGFQESTNLAKKGIDMDSFSQGDENSKLPVVFERDGRVFANSRDVAAYFEKRHDHVIRDIDNLLKDLPTPNLGAALFIESSYQDANGQERRCIDMTRDGFSLLAMGFTGAKALGFKLRYIEQFNAMEATLKAIPASRDPMDVLRDPAAMRGLLLTYSEKVLSLESKVDALAPKADGFDRIAGADGSMCITDAAKALQIRPKDLFDWMRRNGWIYGRQGKAGYLAYQDKMQTGYLEHKVTTVYRNDGSEKIMEAVRVTPKGLSKLSLVVSGALRPGAPTLDAAE